MLKKIKIAHIIYGLKYGGAEKLLIPLTTKINKDRFETVVIVLCYGGPIEQRLREKGVRVIVLRRDAKFGILDFFKLIKILKREKVKIIHTHLFLADFWGGIASRFCRGSIHISTIHGIHLLGSSRDNFKQWLRVRIPKYIIVVSKATARLCIKDLGISGRKIRVIYNGIPIRDSEDSLSKNLKRELGIENFKIILNVASLEWIKGHIYLIQSAEKLLKKRRDIVFLIIGDGRLRGWLQKTVKNKGLQHHIRFLGEKEDIDEYLRISDIFINTSLSEGLPLSILEAMASKKCVVATDVGGNSEIIDNNIDGILIPPKDSSKLAEILDFLIDRGSLRKEIGKRGFLRVKKLFTQKRMLKEIEDFYIKLTDGHLNITLIDVYSPANIGSYSLLENSLKIIKRSFKDYNFQILAFDPSGIERLTGIKSYSELFPLPFGKSIFEKIIWVLVNFLWFFLAIFSGIFNIPCSYLTFSKIKRKALRVIKESDVIISIGAERINDNLYKAVPFYLFQYWLIRKMGKKLIFFPQTIGPFYFKITKFLTRISLSKTALIMVRDKFSQMNLLSLGIKNNIEFIPDVALIQKSIPPQEALKILSKEVPLNKENFIFLGSSLLEWSYFRMRSSFSQYKYILTAFFDWIIETTGLKIICFSTNFPLYPGAQDDIGTGLKIRDNLKYKENFFVLRKLYLPRVIKGMISLGEVFLSTRMHATIFSTSSFIPTISINYQPKSKEYMRLLGLEKFSIDIDKLDIDILKQMFSELWENRGKIRESLKMRIPQLIERVWAIPEILKIYLGDNRGY